MNYSFLAQDGTMTVTPSSSGFRGFFRPFTRFFFPPPQFFPQNVAACIPVGPLPAGTLGRDANGNLTVDGQTYCNPQASRVVARPYGPIYYP